MSRHLWLIVFLYGLVIDAALSAILVMLFWGDQDILFGFLVIFAGVFAVSGAVGLWKAFKRWALFAWPIRKQMEREYLRAYINSALPDPEGAFDLDQYLGGVQNDEATRADVRVKAAFLLGQIDGMRKARPSAGIMAYIAGEKALGEYRPK